MLNVNFRPKATIVSVVATLSLLASPQFGGVARADDYIQSFSGTVVAQYNGAPLREYPTQLKSVLDRRWTTIRGQACQKLRDAIKPTQWKRCDLPAGGELRAKQLAPNSIGLKYIVANNHLNFDVPTVWPLPDATVDVHFDVELHVTLNFTSGIDGAVPSNAADYGGQPATVTAATVNVANAHISTDNLAAKIVDLITGDISTFENQLNQTSFNIQNDVTPSVQTTNGQLHDGARELGDNIRRSTPASNWFFNLDVFVQPEQRSNGVVVQPSKLVVNFRRDFAPPGVPWCWNFGTFNNRNSATNYCTNNPHGTRKDTLVIQRQRADGSLTDEPTAVDSSPNVGFGTGNLYFETWLYDLNPFLPGPAVQTYQVCGSNLYGKACTVPEMISPNPTGWSFGDGRGGDGGGPAPIRNRNKPVM